MECNIAILCLDQLNNFTAVLLDQFWFVLEIFCSDRLPYLDLATKLTMFCGRILGAISMVKSCKWDAACFHKADSAWCVSEQNHLQLLHGQTMPGIFILTSQRRRGGQNSLVVRPWSGLPSLGMAKMKTDIHNARTFASIVWDKFTLEHAVTSISQKKCPDCSVPPR